MGIKELLQKFAADKDFAAIKDAAELNTFLSGQGIELTVDEKTQTLEYLQSGRLPLGDEELNNVSGGCGGRNLDPSCSECGGENVTVKHIGPHMVLKCHSCGVTIDPDGIIPAVG